MNVPSGALVVEGSATRRDVLRCQLRLRGIDGIDADRRAAHGATLEVDDAPETAPPGPEHDLAEVRRLSARDASFEPARRASEARTWT
jgi:hypothetical protein